MVIFHSLLVANQWKFGVIQYMYKALQFSHQLISWFSNWILPPASINGDHLRSLRRFSRFLSFHLSRPTREIPAFQFTRGRLLNSHLLLPWLTLASNSFFTKKKQKITMSSASLTKPRARIKTFYSLQHSLTSRSVKLSFRPTFETKRLPFFTFERSSQDMLRPSTILWPL